MLWRELQRQNFTQIEELLDYLEMDVSLRSHILKKPKFPLNLPRRLASKIKKNTLEDPILRQFVPLEDEKRARLGFVADPVADATFRKGNKLLVKYEGRALLVCTSACAMNCRFCFRQNFDYVSEVKGFEEELRLIAEDPSLSEIILSGGDPLSLSNEALGDLIQKLGQIPHLKRLRFHSRFPIGIPERIDEEFLRILESSRLQTIFIIHANHARELDGDVLEALAKLRRLGIPVLHQAVLTKGVNDAVAPLKELMEHLVDNGIIPYYLHQLDKVEGAAHFEVEESSGARLIEELLSKVSGYAVPRYVRETAGKHSKTPIG